MPGSETGGLLMSRAVCLAFAVLAAAPAAGQDPTTPPRQDGVVWDDAKPTLRLGGGAFTASPILRLDADAGSYFGQDAPGGYRSGVNLRRGRLGVRGTVLQDFSYNFTWDFGGATPNDYSNLFEAQVAYTGLDGATIRAGAFTPQHLPEYAASSLDLLFMERASITSIASSLASGDTRLAVGIEGNGAIGSGGARWNASGYVTGGVASTPNDDRQRGVAGRAVVLALAHPDLQLQLGVDFAAQLHPGTNPGPAAVRLRDYPELRVDSRRLLDSGSIPADHAMAVGPELAGRLGPLYFEALWQRVEIDATNGGDRSFEGWYIQGAYPLIGPARERNQDDGTWERPATEGWINPSANNWGALELAARYSTVDLRDGTRGSNQSIWTVGLNWYLSRQLRLAAQYQNGTTNLFTSNRDFQAVGLRAIFSL
jgi:phosphate-selective porin OprO/OprP